MSDAASGVRQSPLRATHLEHSARLVPFGGWEMPLEYDQGTLHEHRTCRSDAVVFDVSHLGTVRIDADDGFDRLQQALTNDLRKIGPGRAQYTHLVDEDGFVVDDIIVWWHDDGRFDVMPNASNTDEVQAALGPDVEDITEQRVVLAIQGPNARARLAEVNEAAASVGRFRVGSFEWEGHQCAVAGTGYTGEDGVECALPVAGAATFWSALVDAGVAPAGLGARDTLRLEAGLPLHGSELGPGITPLQARLGWVIGWDKDEFRGRDALAAERERGPERLLFGLSVPGRRPPRADYAVRIGDEPVGEVTSGNFSPMLGHGIALAFLPPATEIGDAVELEGRGKRMPAEVVETPFVTSS